MCINYFDKESLEKWFTDEGDKTHRLNYDLNEDSFVIDLGGYVGEWSEQIYNKYNCNIYIFEPVKEYYDELLKKFNGNKKIKIFNFGLSNKSSFIDIFHNDASSSIYLTEGFRETIKLEKFSDFIKKEKIESVDLIKINIEGAEYDLLDHILDQNLQNKFKNFQVQFHKMLGGTDSRRNKIRSILSNSHKLTYDYTYVWENWEKK